MIQQIKVTKWVSGNKRDLIVINNDNTAQVIPVLCAPAELRDLADACFAAAAYLERIAEQNEEL
jgi:hypothetical protein